MARDQQRYVLGGRPLIVGHPSEIPHAQRLWHDLGLSDAVRRAPDWQDWTSLLKEAVGDSITVSMLGSVLKRSLPLKPGAFGQNA
eukprot:521050-Amphidinium_carterae.1